MSLGTGTMSRSRRKNPDAPFLQDRLMFVATYLEKKLFAMMIV